MGSQKNTHYQQLVLMTQGVHPFPSRTRKLSPVVPKIVPWRRGVKIGRCQHLIVSIFFNFIAGLYIYNNKEDIMDFQNQLHDRLKHSTLLTKEQAYQKCINGVYGDIKQNILQTATNSKETNILSGELPFSTSIGYTEDHFQSKESDLYYITGSDPYLYLRDPCKLFIKSGFSSCKASISLTLAGRRYIQDLERLASMDNISLSFKPFYQSTYCKKALSAFDVFEKVQSTHLASATLLICWQVKV